MISYDFMKMIITIIASVELWAEENSEVYDALIDRILLEDP